MILSFDMEGNMNESQVPKPPKQTSSYQTSSQVKKHKNVDILERKMEVLNIFNQKQTTDQD